MYKIFLSTIIAISTCLHAQTPQVKEQNATSKEKLLQEQLQKQMQKEEKFAKEQKFYQGDEYDLKAVEINQKSLKNIPVIEPDYDFDITDVYRDDI
ncbi:hypothetical protein MNB_SV-3-1512 [hydrothermal vent metagenome]|uniref:Uncharacterized protein n=1 Tax=hydrothermal vent metagenome TaxID=652676 RepID=A0A1W1CEV6_9ZZZZ